MFYTWEVTRTQTYQVPRGTGKTKNGIIPVPIIVNGTNTHNSGVCPEL
jgi:hypothetical protein